MRRLAKLASHVQARPAAAAEKGGGATLEHPRAEGPEGGVGLALDPGVRGLTQEEVAQFREKGYVRGLPVFTPEAATALQSEFQRISGVWEQRTGRVGSDISRVNMWHKANKWVYDLSRTPAILDYVQAILGPDFYQWGAHFFVKYPGDGTVVPWHQDAQYWPLSPHKTVSVWLAFYDATEENGAMQLMQGTHKQGKGEGAWRHHKVEGEQYMLNQEADADQIVPEDVVTMIMPAGQCSIHDDGLLHGSQANRSASAVRAGLVMRYVPTEVKGDTAVWKTHESFMCRGVDRHRLNAEGKAPTSPDGVPTEMFMHSSEFA
jgi:ectoine hydroxylase-related dioxygenase (phytanoyl-CoA dioxygenase family)